MPPNACTIVAADRYGCANHRNRGTCANALTIRRAELETRVLAGLKDRLLAPELVKSFIAEFHAEANRQRQTVEIAWQASRQELTEVDRKIGAMLTAIENGVVTASTRDRLLALERRKTELEHQQLVAPLPRLHPNLAEVYRQKVASLQEALNRDDCRTEAAEALRQLIEEIQLTPDESAAVLRAELYGELGAILALADARNAKCPGAGAPGRGGVVSLIAGARNHLFRTTVHWPRGLRRSQ